MPQHQLLLSAMLDSSRSSRFQKGNDSVVFPLGKAFLTCRKLPLKQWDLSPVRLNLPFYYKYF
jgi:hypothetical protein